MLVKYHKSGLTHLRKVCGVFKHYVSRTHLTIVTFTFILEESFVIALGHQRSIHFCIQPSSKDLAS